MPRPKKEGTNITIRFSDEEYAWIVSHSKTEWGEIHLSQIVRTAIRKLMESES